MAQPVSPQPRSLGTKIWTIVSVVLTVVGASGIPDNLKAWGRLFAMIGSDLGRWLLVLGGLAILIWINRRGIYQLFHSTSASVQPGAADATDTPVFMSCPQCGGNAKHWGRWEKPCVKCKAFGMLPGEFLAYAPCAYCGGNGREAGRWEKDCQVCNGYGRRVPAELQKSWEAFTVD